MSAFHEMHAQANNRRRFQKITSYIQDAQTIQRSAGLLATHELALMFIYAAHKYVHTLCTMQQW